MGKKCHTIYSTIHTVNKKLTQQSCKGIAAVKRTSQSGLISNFQTPMRYILLVGLLVQCCNVVAQRKIFSTSLSERVQFMVSQGLEKDSLDVVVVTQSKNPQDSLHGRILYSYPASHAFLVRTTAASV